MKYKNWKVPSAPPVVPRSLEQAVGSRLLAAILHLRGLGGLDDAESFLLGGMETLHDPCTLTDILPGRLSADRAASAGSCDCHMVFLGSGIQWDCVENHNASYKKEPKQVNRFGSQALFCIIAYFSEISSCLFAGIMPGTDFCDKVPGTQ